MSQGRPERLPSQRLLLLTDRGQAGTAAAKGAARDVVPNWRDQLPAGALAVGQEE